MKGIFAALIRLTLRGAAMVLCRAPCSVARAVYRAKL